MNDALNRRIHNYLERLGVYFERPQIFDTTALATEASALMLEVDNERSNDTCEDDFTWPPYEVPK